MGYSTLYCKRTLWIKCKLTGVTLNWSIILSYTHYLYKWLFIREICKLKFVWLAFDSGIYGPGVYRLWPAICYQSSKSTRKIQWIISDVFCTCATVLVVLFSAIHSKSCECAVQCYGSIQTLVKFPKFLCTNRTIFMHNSISAYFVYRLICACGFDIVRTNLYVLCDSWLGFGCLCTRKCRHCTRSLHVRMAVKISKNYTLNWHTCHMEEINRTSNWMMLRKKCLYIGFSMSVRMAASVSQFLRIRVNSNGSFCRFHFSVRRSVAMRSYEQII